MRTVFKCADVFGNSRITQQLLVRCISSAAGRSKLQIRCPQKKKSNPPRLCSICRAGTCVGLNCNILFAKQLGVILCTNHTTVEHLAEEPIAGNATVWPSRSRSSPPTGNLHVQLPHKCRLAADDEALQPSDRAGKQSLFVQSFYRPGVVQKRRPQGESMCVCAWFVVSG